MKQSVPHKASGAFLEWWSSCSLAMQFAIVGSFVLVCGMAVIGSWVAEKIEQAVVHNTAASTALYMDSVLGPHVQELDQESIVSDDNRERLDEHFIDTEIGERISSVKIWKESGQIAYSINKSIIGKTFPVTHELELAWSGEIAAEFDSLEDEEDAIERRTGLTFLEIYSPIRNQSDQIIAVSEFYVNAEALERDLHEAQTGSWLVVGFVTLTMIGLLSGIVLRGSRTIENQKQSLVFRIQQLSELKERLERSSRIASELNENFLRRLGSELHDGPAQLVGFALLRLDSIGNYGSNDETAGRQALRDKETIRTALSDALKEIRNISAGLVLPEYDAQPLKDGIAKIITIHEQRTQTKVSRNLSDLPNDIDKSIKISIFRMVQEGLNNAFRHAAGAAVMVSASFKDNRVSIEVADKGPGFETDPKTENVTTSLGLPGLRERIESIGGHFIVESSKEGGTRVSAHFSI